MFETFELQNLNKLIKGEVRDFPAPQAFHTLKVQRLGNERIKPSTQVSRPFVMPVFTLVGDVPIQPCELTDTSPPIVRTFDLTAKCLTESSQFFQGMFQELWRVYLLTCAERQIGIQAEIYPYALTCSRIGFGRGIVSDNIHPKCSNGVAKDLDIADISVPFTVVVKRKPTLLKLKGLRGCVPRFERESDTSLFYEIRRLELRRTVAVFALELRQSTETVKKTVVRNMDTDNHLIKCVAGYPRPMVLRAFQQLRQMRLQAIPSRIQTVAAIIPFFQSKEVVMHVAQVVKHIAQAHIFRMFAYLIFIRSASAFLFSLSLVCHWISRITALTPNQWVADTLPSGNAGYVCQRDTYIKPQFAKNVKCFFKKTLWPHTRGRTFLPNLKDGVSSPYFLMKKPVFLILIGIGIALLVVGVVFVVPWFGIMMEEMEQIAEQHGQHRRALEQTAREPLTEEQEILLYQLLEITAETDISQNPNDLEGVLSSEPYLAYLKAQEAEDYEDFLTYVNAMPTANMQTVALSRIQSTLGTDYGDEELSVWTNYYFIVREWGITVEDPRDNIQELNELHQTHLITPLMESDPEMSDLSTKIVQIGMSSMFMTEDNNVFKDAWRERLETHGEQEGILRCAIASADEFALMRSFFVDMAAFQEWILALPEPKAQESEE